MAKAITCTTSVKFGNKVLTQSGSSTSTGDDLVEQTGTVGTTGEALPVGDVGTEGLLMIQNNHASNTLLVALDGGTNYDIVIQAGHTNLISVGTTGAVYVKGSAADTTYTYFLTEE